MKAVLAGSMLPIVARAAKAEALPQGGGSPRDGRQFDEILSKVVEGRHRHVSGDPRRTSPVERENPLPEPGAAAAADAGIADADRVGPPPQAFQSAALMLGPSRQLATEPSKDEKSPGARLDQAARSLDPLRGPVAAKRGDAALQLCEGATLIRASAAAGSGASIDGPAEPAPPVDPKGPAAKLDRSGLLSLSGETHFKPLVARPMGAATDFPVQPAASAGVRVRDAELEMEPAKPHRQAAGPMQALVSADFTAHDDARSQGGESDDRRRERPLPPRDLQMRDIGEPRRAAVAGQSAGLAEPVAPTHTAEPASPAQPVAASLMRQVGAAIAPELRAAAGSSSSPKPDFDPQQRSLQPMRVIVVALDPAELGRVTVRLRSDGDALSVQVTAERAETSALLQREHHLLKDILGAHGQFEDVAVQVQPASTAQSAGAPAGFDAARGGPFPQFSSGQGEGGRNHAPQQPTGGPQSGDSDLDAPPADAPDGAGLYV